MVLLRPPSFSEVMPQYITLLAHAERDAFANFLANTLQRGSEGGAAQSAKSATPWSSRGFVGWDGGEQRQVLGRRLGRMIIKDRPKKGMTMIARSERTAKNGEGGRLKQ